VKECTEPLTFWASSVKPTTTNNDFAVGTSHGTFIIEEMNAGFSKTAKMDTPRDVLAVDWLDQNVVMNGCRDGEVWLWDTRAEGRHACSNRISTPSCISRVRKVNDNKIVVAGIQRYCSVYDLRRPLKSDQLYTTPYVSFSGYSNCISRRLGFDVCQNLVAATTGGEIVQIFDVDTGKEMSKLDTGSEGVGVKFVDGDVGLKLLVATKGYMQEWACWEG